jgi:hypothetical protein
MGSAYYVITSLFPFSYGVQVDTIKLHYFRNLYFPLKLFEVRDRGFNFLTGLMGFFIDLILPAAL